MPWALECHSQGLIPLILLRTCFESFSTSGFRVDQIRTFPLTLRLSKGASEGNRHTQAAQELIFSDGSGLQPEHFELPILLRMRIKPIEIFRRVGIESR